MRWVALTLAGPALWAVLFSAVYGLHGGLCAGVSGPEGLATSARLTLVALWLAGLLGHAALIWTLPRGDVLSTRLPHLGGWIGLVASFFTLFPVAIATSC